MRGRNAGASGRERYARKLPLSVICELLGLPTADRPKFMAWAGNITGVRSTIGFSGA
jgi:cytochrome P450